MSKSEQSTGLKSQKKAEKHIDISLKVKKIVNQNFSPKYKVYLAAYSARKIYQEIEKKITTESGEEFYGIRLHSSTIPKRENLVKEPDILVSDDKNAKFIIEVKWGAIGGCLVSDLKDFESDLRKMNKFDPKSHWTCRVNGKIDFDVNDKTRFILVSDFDKAINVIGKKKFEEIRSKLQSKFQKLNINFELADIHKRVDYIPSLQEII